MSGDRVESKKKSEEEILSRIALVVAILAFLALPLFMLLSNLEFKRINFENLSKFGDYVGGLTTAFFTLSSVIFLFAAFILQKKELGETRKQLEETVKQSKITNDTMKLQQFETTFFNMINMHSNLVTNMKLYGEKYQGREVFVKYYEDILNFYKTESLKSYLQRLLVRNRDLLKELSEEYLEFYYKSDYYDTDFDEYYSEEEFEKAARNFIMGNRYDSILMQDITVLHIFKLNYDEFEKTCQKFDYLKFSNRMEREFFNSPEYKENAIRMVEHENYFPISHYLKSVKVVLKFVDGANFDTDKKYEYLNIFFSQFTSHEIMIIYYYTSFNIEEDLKHYFTKYKNLIIKDYKLDDSFI